jgi:hypothetical protein
VAPSGSAPAAPLQSFELRIGLNAPRHHDPFLPLCGRPGLQSFLDQPVVPHGFNTPSPRFARGGALRFSRPVPELIFGKKILSPLLTFRPTIRFAPTRPALLSPRP